MHVTIFRGSRHTRYGSPVNRTARRKNTMDPVPCHNQEQDRGYALWTWDCSVMPYKGDRRGIVVSCVCVFTCVCMQVHVHVAVKGVLLNHSPLCFEMGSCWTWISPMQVSWLITELQGSSRCPLRRAQVTNVCCCIQYFMWVLGNQRWGFMLAWYSLYEWKHILNRVKMLCASWNGCQHGLRYSEWIANSFSVWGMCSWGMHL